MGDEPGVHRDLAKPTVQVHRLRYEEQIAEKRYQLKRLEADLEKFINGTIKKMEADKIMLERDIMALSAECDRLDNHGNNEVIDIKAITQQ